MVIGGIASGRVDWCIWFYWAADRNCNRLGSVHGLFGLRTSYPYQLNTRYQAGVDDIEATRGYFRPEIGERRR